MNLKEGLVRTKSGMVMDILDENTEGANDETADKVVG